MPVYTLHHTSPRTTAETRLLRSVFYIDPVLVAVLFRGWVTSFAAGIDSDLHARAGRTEQESEIHGQREQEQAHESDEREGEIEIER